MDQPKLTSGSRARKTGREVFVEQALLIEKSPSAELIYVDQRVFVCHFTIHMQSFSDSQNQYHCLATDMCVTRWQKCTYFSEKIKIIVKV